MINIADKLKNQLPRDIFLFLMRIGILADVNGRKAYLVGGCVRDILLGVENFDIDLVVEPDAIGFAQILSEEFKTEIIAYKAFGTATIFTNAPIKKYTDRIDLATARIESYKKPGVLPKVKFATIREDLRRRDFAINAMAVSLNKNTFGELIDFFNGSMDLKKKNIRVLHDLSFVNDPTRIFRAVKFAKRLGFKIEPHTLGLLKSAIKEDMLGRLKKQRVEKEINLILSEDKAGKIILEIFELHKNSWGIL